MNDGSTPAGLIANAAMAYGNDGASVSVAQAIPMQTLTGMVAVAALPTETVDAVTLVDAATTDSKSDAPAGSNPTVTPAANTSDASGIATRLEEASSTAPGTASPAAAAAVAATPEQPATLQATGDARAMAAPATPVIDPGLLATSRTTTASTRTADPGAMGAPTSGAGAVGGTVLALLLVVGLILAMAWLAKRMPGVSGTSNPHLKLIGSLALGPRERVVVVEVGGKQLLLSTGAGGTRTLHTLDEPLPAREPTQAPAFAQMLARQLKKSTGMGKA